VTRAEAILLSVRCIRQLCSEAGISRVRSRLLEADFEHLLWSVSESETPDDWREYLERTDIRKIK
jgi:predicted secreted protein